MLTHMKNIENRLIHVEWPFHAIIYVVDNDDIKGIFLQVLMDGSLRFWKKSY